MTLLHLFQDQGSAVSCSGCILKSQFSMAAEHKCSLEERFVWSTVDKSVIKQNPNHLPFFQNLAKSFTIGQTK